MSVFTVVTETALVPWLEACGAGQLLAIEGVEGGVENTNYRIETAQGTFVLTLFEWMPQEAAERTLAFTALCANAGLPVAAPWPQRAVQPVSRSFSVGRWTAMLAGKPAALARWIDGTHPDQPTPAQCTAIGDFLGRLHTTELTLGSDPRVSLGFDSRGHAWRAETAARVAPLLTPDDCRLLDTALADVTALPLLPEGAIHADLFRDNALFEGDTLRGVIDFHYACNGPFAYDLAVAALDWCADATAEQALLAGYARHRVLNDAELAEWPRLNRMAALRFWLSRFHDTHFPRAGGVVLVKDPDVMRDRLRGAMV